MSDNLPSIYEIFEQENLFNGMRSGFKYLANILASNNPGHFQILHQYFDEFYLFHEIIIQGIYLISYSASFCEHFYNLKRVKCDSSRLSSRDIASSLLVTSSFSYLKSKFDKFYDELSRIQFEGLLNRDVDKFAFHFVNNYPYLKTLWEVSCLVYQIKYAVSVSKTHHPLFHLLGLRLIRNDPRDMKRRGLVLKIAKGVGMLMTSAALVVQFIDFWYSRESSRSSYSTLSIPPAPKKRETPNTRPNDCPLCSQPRRNEVLLKTSGFLFCQECLVNFVQKNEKCPITGYPTNLSQIVPIYQSDSF
ncbi:peroxisome assembly protein 12 [Tetranychus urticae]|uniref:Peroxisome assembly protein 12 n=1 Tax=Tetranychus urticae TaxID=32264 RepID=T1JVC2_TETUR|nr:peroxisome assembly protein 12 [Tetranychus urticae]